MNIYDYKKRKQEILLPLIINVKEYQGGCGTRWKETTEKGTFWLTIFPSH